MIKFLGIQDAAKYLGVSPQTLRRWEKNKKITPAHRTQGGQRRYSLAQLKSVDCCDKTTDRPTVAYARVSSHDQKEDLQRQVHMLEMYCSSKGWPFSVIKDLGSGMNYNKRGLKLLLEQIMNGQIGRLVLTHKDRLLRFGAELVFSLCAVKNVEVVIINLRRAMNNRSLIGRWKSTLSWVARKSGKTFIEFDEKGTTRTCHHCLHVEEQGIPVNLRQWQCPQCQTEHIRDENAAINGLKKVLRDLPQNDEGEYPSIVSSSDLAFVKERWAWCVLPSGVVIHPQGQSSKEICSARKLNRGHDSPRSKSNHLVMYNQV